MIHGGQIQRFESARPGLALQSFCSRILDEEPWPQQSSVARRMIQKYAWDPLHYLFKCRAAVLQINLSIYHQKQDQRLVLVSVRLINCFCNFGNSLNQTE